MTRRYKYTYQCTKCGMPYEVTIGPSETVAFPLCTCTDKRSTSAMCTFVIRQVEPIIDSEDIKTITFNDSIQHWRAAKLVHYVNKIEDEQIREFVFYCLFFAPRSYWLAPSSPSGKHHPIDECLEGGQLLHVLRVCGYAEVLLQIREELYINKDIIWASCVLHDVAKFGLNDDLPYKTNHEHYELAEVFLRGVAKYICIDREDLYRIVICIMSHHGRWGKHEPKSDAQILVHEADAIASMYREER